MADTCELPDYSVGPGPGKYSGGSSSFKLSLNRPKGFSFSTGRQTAIKPEVTPDPRHYHREFKDEAVTQKPGVPSYSVGGEKRFHSNGDPYAVLHPGPGAHAYEEEDELTHAGAGTRFGKESSKYRQLVTDTNPGAGTYAPEKTTMPGCGDHQVR
jgi:hypothetical protein